MVQTGRQIFHRTWLVGMGAALLAVLAMAVTASAGDLQVREDGSSTALTVFPVGPSEEDGRLVVVVTNLDATRSINKVRFEGHPTADRSLAVVEWSMASFSAAGWSASVNNEASINLLTFSQTTGAAIAPGQSSVFILIYDVVRAENQAAPRHGTLLPVKVDADYTGGGRSTVYSFSMFVDDKAPEILESGGAGVVTGDADSNGHLDEIHITFTERIDESTFAIQGANAATWSIGPYEITRVSFRVIQPGAALFVGNPGMGVCPAGSTFGCSQARLFIAERGEYDTGQKPSVKYTQPPSGQVAVRDVAGNPLASVTVATKDVYDGAPPVMVGALAVQTDSDPDDFEAVLVTFSEVVVGQATDKKIRATDFEYTDVPGGVVNIDSADPPAPKLLSTTAIPDGIQVGSGSPFPVLLHLDTPLSIVDAPADHPATATADIIGCDGIKDQAAFIGSTTAVGYACVTSASIVSMKALEAIGNIGTREIKLRFSGPVESYPTGTEQGNAVGRDALALQATTSGGPSGITNVQHVRCSEEITITVNNDLKPDDVDSTPVKVQILGNKIRGCTKAGTGTGAIQPTVIPAQLVGVQDTVAPKITSATTVDRDSNGVIDGLQIQFSEPVSDVTFCAGSNPCPIGGIIRLASSGPGAGSGTDPLAGFGPFRWDTGANENDALGTITWPQNNPERTESLDTGYIPDLLVEAGLIRDMVPDSAPNPANLMLAASSPDIDELDTAPPVLLKASTLDTEVLDLVRDAADCGVQGTTPIPDDCVDRNCLLEIHTGCIEDPNGSIDTYMLHFSEPVLDSSFHPEEWSIDGRTVGQVWQANRAGNGRNDRILAVQFSESGVPDTDARPDVTYALKPGLKGLTDLAGNRLSRIETKTVEEFDGARPVIVKAQAFESDDAVRILFSEPVDDGRGGALVHNDFTYINSARSSPQGPSGIVNSPQARHLAGQELAIVSVDRPFTDTDFPHNDTSQPPRLLPGDGIQARIGTGTDIGSIFETAAKTVGEKQYVLGNKVDITRAADILSPGPIKDLNHILAQPTFIGLNWTAPGDDGNENGTVEGYYVKISKSPFTSFNVTSHDLLPGLTEAQLAFDPPAGKFAAPGVEQTLLVKGLKPSTKYYVAIIAFDEEKNISPIGNVHEVSTLRDPTPPAGDLQVKVEKAVNGQVGSTFEATWKPATDPESDIIYRYLLSESATTIVSADKGESTPDTKATFSNVPAGMWYVHVRAFSDLGGNPSQVRIEVLPPQLTSTAMAEYRDRFNKVDGPEHSVDVVRSKEGNLVNWTLPQNPPGDITSVRIWRLGPGAEYVLVKEITGSFATLRTGSYLDADGKESSRYMVDTVFAGQQSAAEPQAAFDEGTPVSNIDKGLPLWAWILIAIGGLLIIASVVLLLVLRTRRAPTEEASSAQGWAEVDEQAGAAVPRHEVDCPNCSHNFTVQGHLPMPITCPECGVTGKLE